MNEGLNADAAKPHVSKTGIALLLVGLLMLLAWVLLPWIHQPERGPTLARIISAERSANELDIQRQGLSLPPIAALVTMGLALWGMFSPQHSRALALVTLIAGLLGLVYHLTFFLDLGERSGELLAQMGSGFWLTLLAGCCCWPSLRCRARFLPAMKSARCLVTRKVCWRWASSR